MQHADSKERHITETVAHEKAALPPAPAATGVRATAPAIDGFLTVLVTPKLTFTFPRQTSWQTAEDISQSTLRDAFLSRFPLKIDADKLLFTCTTPSLSLEGRERLVYRISSTTGGDDERVLLLILSSLDKAYGAFYEKKFEEVRADMLSSTMSFQVVADEVREAQQAAARHWDKEVKGLKEQLSMNQKRLFLLEREKEGLVKTVHSSDEVASRLRRSVESLSSENTALRERQSDLEAQVGALRDVVTAHLSGMGTPGGDPPGPAAPSSSVGTQTAQLGTETHEAELAARLAVEKWQQAMGAWLRTGAELCSTAVGAEAGVSEVGSSIVLAEAATVAAAEAAALADPDSSGC
mmetsp:Transcript_23978/g.61201  ORF Transcript_23978/g.61201 Transcript_23978/m.61201 type:complete len:352 (-) Transcript_23978:267-1322(-)|eukprot:CAMPEP_0115848650 /NCGR_PEP_ID=MMETSP0287-20121206/11035_1 /TAXON_ID=412157 /ORGANISM="Chrysochromulina rotalis, Strain UIO044" /LENGTH=351 /DNA_ID=CAMNT_0003302577 /DNA_START=132 /DNA_END=1187 /DNA_ORIENTATION=+